MSDILTGSSAAFSTDPGIGTTKVDATGSYGLGDSANRAVAAYMNEVDTQLKLINQFFNAESPANSGSFANDINVGGDAFITGTVDAASGTFSDQVRGKCLWYSFHYYERAGSDQRIIPWGHDVDRGTVINSGTNGVAPHDGQLKEVVVRSENTDGMGSTSVEFHDALLSSSQDPVETVTANVPDENAVAFVFSASNFSKLDPLSIKIDPTNSHHTVTVTCIWEYDQST